ncbi:caleosin related protein [Hirsutella rhossiliensis]|uniref:Caleosin related protein n=1 Tax=Hirsutella rhossiliensis TaxID=111463 RepID=A0A9P8N4N0_9HYPO|nr:caleosin related protein [Hirsutella rhossiliensis]KAH0965876.1 caleosin related protein [Hirsutella rhossiliensis]
MGSTKDGVKSGRRKEHSEAKDGDGVKSGGHKKKRAESKASHGVTADGQDAEHPGKANDSDQAGGPKEHPEMANDGEAHAETNKAPGGGVKADGPKDPPDSKANPESKANDSVKRDGLAGRAETKADNGNKPGVVTSIPEVPITVQRKPFVQPDDKVRLPHAGTARASLAATYERPDGTAQGGWAERHQNQTVLQQHVEFFDQDRDGVIWPVDTFKGFYALGYGIAFSLLAAAIINGAFSYPTLSGYLPDPLFRIYIRNIHKDKHGSDSGTYDAEGRFVPQKFEEIFSKYAEGRDYVTVPDVLKFLRGQRLLADPFGWLGALFEWLATYLLLWPANGRMAKEDIRGVYDGSIFYTIAARREKLKNRG